MSTYVVIVDQYIEEFKYRDKILAWFIIYCKTEFTATKKKPQWKYNLDIKGLNLASFPHVHVCITVEVKAKGLISLTFYIFNLFPVFGYVPSDRKPGADSRYS